jgi:uncharacterized protein involved in exopolysaccharide biosynthesis
VEETYNRYTQGKTQTDPTARDLLTPIFRRKRLLGVTFLALLALAVAASFLLSSDYKSHMEILVNRERQDPMVTSEATNQMALAPPVVTEEEINSEVELLQSPDLLREVVLANGLQEAEKKSLTSLLRPTQEAEWYVARAVKHLDEKLKIEVVRKTNVIAVDYKSSDPKIAHGVLNKLASLYMQKHMEVHRPQGSFDLFAKETEKYRQALADSELQLADFGNQEGVAAPNVQRDNMAQELVDSESTLHQAEQAMAADRQRIMDEQGQMKAMPARSSTVELSSTPDLLLQQLGTRLLEAKVKRTQLGMKYDASYPLVQEADEELAETRAAFAEAQKTKFLNQSTDRDPTYESIRFDIAKTQADLASQVATAQAVQHSIRTINAQMVKLDHSALKQADLLREAKANEANYLLYLSKREQERTSDALDQKRIGNVAMAVPPLLPVLPAYSFPMLMLIGIFVAIFLSIATTYVVDYLNSSIRTPSEVNDVLGIPTLACFPKRAA